MRRASAPRAEASSLRRARRCFLLGEPAELRDSARKVGVPRPQRRLRHDFRDACQIVAREKRLSALRAEIVQLVGCVFSVTAGAFQVCCVHLLHRSSCVLRSGNRRMVALCKVTRAQSPPPRIQSVIANLRFIAALLLVSVVPVWLDRRLRRRGAPTDRR